MVEPTIKVEVAFANDASAGTGALVWTDVSADVRSVSTSRGRNQELDAFQAGRASVVLSNAGRVYDPTNLAGPHVDGDGTQILPMKRVRIRADYSSPTPDVIEGFEDATLDITVAQDPDNTVAWARTTAAAQGPGTWSFGSAVLSEDPISAFSVAIPAGTVSLSFWYKTVWGFIGGSFYVSRGQFDYTSTLFSTLDEADWTRVTLSVVGLTHVTFSNTVGGIVEGNAVYIDDIVLSASYSEAMFEGYVDTWRQQYTPPSDAVAVLEATDAFKVLAQTDVNLSPFALAIADSAPTYWFKLNESEGSTKVFDSVAGVEGTLAPGGALGGTGLLYFDNATAYTQNEGNTTERISIPGAGIINNLPAQSLALNQDGSNLRNMVTTDDSSAMDGFTAGLDIRVRLVRPATWNSTYGYLFGKGGFSASNGGFEFALYQNTNLRIMATGSTDVTDKEFSDSFASMVAVGQVFWAGATLQNTSGNLWAVKFYINLAATPPADITTWTPVNAQGDKQLDLASGTLQSNVVGACVGARGYLTAGGGTTSNYSGLNTNILEAQLRNNINGALVANPQFTNSGQWTVGESAGDKGTDAQGNEWTLRREAPQPVIRIVSGAAKAFSVEALVQTTDTTASRVIAFQGTLTGAGVYWLLQTGPGGIAQFFINNGTNFIILGSTTPITDGEIHFVAATYDESGNAALYVDGVLEASGIKSVVVSAGDLYIGNLSADLANRNWVGTLDEVLVYDRELTATEVAEHYELTVAPWDGDRTGVRLGRILDSVLWPADKRAIDTGDAAMQSQTLIGTALDLAQNVAMSELFGSLFIARNGDVRFIARRGQYDQPLAASFADAPDSLTPIRNLEPEYGDYLLRNYALIQRVGGAAQTAEDGGSVQRYFRQSFNATGLNHDSDLLSLQVAQSLVGQYAQPQLRVSQLVVQPRALPLTLFPTILALELGDWVDVAWTPQGVGDPITITSVVEQISHTITSGQKGWEVSLNLSPAPVNVVPAPPTTGDAPPAAGAPVPTNSTLDGRVSTVEAGLGAHLADPTAAHAASAVAYTPNGFITAQPNVQAALGDVAFFAADLNARIKSGSATTPGATGSSSVAVSFSAAFALNPRVVATPTTAASAITGWGITGISTTGFTLTCYRSNTTSTAFHWLALSAG